ncbi:MAG: hypothetical protein ACKOQ5_07175 [Solirubrobacterales bacterium]
MSVADSRSLPPLRGRKASSDGSDLDSTSSFLSSRSDSAATSEGSSEEAAISASCSALATWARSPLTASITSRSALPSGRWATAATLSSSR